MKSRDKFFLSVFAVVLFFIAGCASKDFAEPGEANMPRKDTGKIFRANFQKTWDAVVVVAGSMPVVSTDKETGTITTDWVQTKSDRLYSGYGETRIPYMVRYKFKVNVKPTGSGTYVKVTNKEQYYTDSVTSGIDFSGSIYQWLDTESSTKKEADFLQKVEKQLNLTK